MGDIRMGSRVWFKYKRVSFVMGNQIKYFAGRSSLGWDNLMMTNKLLSSTIDLIFILPHPLPFHFPPKRVVDFFLINQQLLLLP